MLERRAVEEDRGVGPAEDARRLVEDPARHPDRPQLGPLAGEGELERLELEVGRRAEREGDPHLERGGRGEAGTGRHGRVDPRGQAERRSAETGELGGDRLAVACPPADGRAAAVGRERLAAGRASWR